MSPYFQYTGREGQGISPTYLTREEIVQLNTSAIHTGFLSQRALDEIQAGRSFSCPKDWIEYTLRTKGERSGRHLMVKVNGSNGHSCYYTQTRDYHSSGGEDLIRMRDGSWGCENFVIDRSDATGDVTLYQQDIERAGVLRRLVASAKQPSGPSGKTSNEEAQQLSQSSPWSRSSLTGATAMSSAWSRDSVPSGACVWSDKPAGMFDAFCMDASTLRRFQSPRIACNEPDEVEQIDEDEFPHLVALLGD